MWTSARLYGRVAFKLTRLSSAKKNFAERKREETNKWKIMCVAMYIMRMYASGRKARWRGRGSKKEKKIGMRRAWGEKEEENRSGGTKRGRERKRDDDKGGERKEGGHADEGGRGTGGMARGKKRGEGATRESIEVYEKTIELICKQ